MNNAKMVIKKGVNKNGKNYSYIQFEVQTSAGIYTTPPIFPSPLELSVLAQSASNNNVAGGIGAVYSGSDTSLKAEF